MTRGRVREPVAAALAVAAIAAFTAIYVSAGVSNATVPLTFLMVVLGVATVSTLRLAVATSILATASFNYFFLPPVGTLTIADPQNWVALLVFLAVSLVASNLSNTARARGRTKPLRGATRWLGSSISAVTSCSRATAARPCACWPSSSPAGSRSIT